jgi:hypothetical protein
LLKNDIIKKNLEESLTDKEYILAGRSDAFGDNKLKLVREFDVTKSSKNKVSAHNIFKQRKFTQQVETVENMRLNQQKIKELRL